MGRFFVERALAETESDKLPSPTIHQRPIKRLESWGLPAQASLLVSQRIAQSQPNLWTNLWTASMPNLTARKVETAKAGKYGDGGGLQLSVSPSGARKWVLRFTWRGRAREMGLGAFPTVSLAEARAKAEDARRLARSGSDPIQASRRASAVPTFGDFADQVAAELAAGFRNEKHRAQWAMTLKVYAAPLRATPVDEIETDDLLTVLKPIWKEKPETASRLRGRIERVLSAASAKGLRDGENPARWRGHLDSLLPKRAALSRGHHAAMPFADVPTFIGRLRERQSVAGLALEFAILTAARTGEVLGARWPEIDLVAKVWTIPAGRTKAAREHRVPLTDRATAILAEAAKLGAAEFVFPGQRAGRPLSSMALEMTLRRMGETATVHGYRSSFRDWAGEETHFPRELAEHALAHVLGDATERAYRRGDALEKRRAMMSAWAAHCERRPPADNVTRLRRGTA